MSTNLRLEVGNHQVGSACVVTLRGELDVASCVLLEEHLAQIPDDQELVIDLSALDFIDSSGIGLLVRLNETAKSEKRSFALINGNGQVRQLLELTGLSQRLPVSDTLSELQAGH